MKAINWIVLIVCIAIGLFAARLTGQGILVLIAAAIGAYFFWKEL